MAGPRKIAVTVVGGVIIAVGVALLVLPGPGLIVVVLGLALLATEYDWAKRSLARARAKAQQASDATVRNPVSTVLTVLFGLALGAVGVLMVLGTELSLFGVEVDELPGWGPFTGVVLALSALLMLASTAYSFRDARRRAELQEQGVRPDTAEQVTGSGAARDQS